MYIAFIYLKLFVDSNKFQYFIYWRFGGMEYHCVNGKAYIITSLINEPCSMENMKQNMSQKYEFLLNIMSFETHFIRPKYPNNILLCAHVCA